MRVRLCPLDLALTLSNPKLMIVANEKAPGASFAEGRMKMSSTKWKARPGMLLCLVSILLLNSPASLAQARSLPNPVLFFLGQEPYTANGKAYIRYDFAVDNRGSYPDSLFAAAPSLPACGANTNASRTWVDIFNQSGKRLYGFCALGKSEDLGKLWFALEEGVVPPSWIYIELNDRQTQTKYKSNLADTTM